MPRKLSLLTLFALLASSLLAALLPLLTAGLSASHDPLRSVSAQVARHAEISSVDQDTANHAHDGGSVGEARSGHQHAHSSIDHSHESLFALPAHSVPFCASAMQWRFCSGTDRKSALVSVLERPPRPATA